MTRREAYLTLEDGSIFEGFLLGYPVSAAGEVVFNTGMVGYPESLTDPSYRGQILILTYPLIGNYGVPAPSDDASQPVFESGRIQVRGLVVANYSEHFAHWQAASSLEKWLIDQQIPGLTGVDTRRLTRMLRARGTRCGQIVVDVAAAFFDPNQHDMVAEVTAAEPQVVGRGSLRIAVLDCGCKASIIASLLRRGAEVLRLPYNADLSRFDFSGLLISNGPGNPEWCRPAIDAIRWSLAQQIPTMGICLGHQLLALASGARTYKLPYGHRGQNQPVKDLRSQRCLITSQNHGYAVDPDTLPPDWTPWFVNLNDGTNEGLLHASGRFLSVQFHPEAAPGPNDAGYLFDDFITMVATHHAR